MCLNHSGGWDRKHSGDPNSFEPRVERALHVRAPVTGHQLRRYMMGRPLDFDPGTETHYSNFGFVLLGLVIARVTGIPYMQKLEADLAWPAVDLFPKFLTAETRGSPNSHPASHQPIALRN